MSRHTFLPFFKLGWKFYDADDYHPEANRQKMGKGIPLNDQVSFTCLLGQRLLPLGLPWHHALGSKGQRAVPRRERLMEACPLLPVPLASCRKPQ